VFGLLRFLLAFGAWVCTGCCWPAATAMPWRTGVRCSWFWPFGLDQAVHPAVSTRETGQKGGFDRLGFLLLVDTLDLAC